LLLQTILTGLACLRGWLHCLKLVNNVISGDIATPWANHLFLSLPGLIGTTWAGCFGPGIMPLLQAIIIGSASLFWGVTAYCIWRSGYSPVEKKQISLVCLFSLLPLMAGYLRDYDYVVVVPAMWVVFFAMDRQSKLFPCALQAILWTIGILDLQMILFVLLKGQAITLSAWFTGLALSFVGVRLCSRVAFKLCQEC